ncbi:unnamed protein product, partial [marine sediment metagenome]
DAKLERERLEQEEKERKEEAARRRKADETLRQHYLAILPWYIPCRKYTEDVVRTFFGNYGYEDWAGTLGSQLALVDERLINVPDELVSGGDQAELVIEGELDLRCLFHLAFLLLLGPVFPDRCPV